LNSGLGLRVFTTGYAYDREKQVALETWGRALKAVLEGRQGTGRVVAFAAT